MKTRKITSIVLTLCLLMSLVSVMFAGTASALTVDATDSEPKYETVLDLNFDAGTADGLAATGYDNNWNNKMADGAVLMVQNVNGGGTLWIGADSSVNKGETKIPSLVTDDATAAEKVSNCFALEPATTYKITFKYRWRDDAHTGAKFDFMCATNPYAATNHGRANVLTNVAVDTYIDGNDTTAADETFGGDNTKYHDWKEETIIFVTKESLTSKYLGIRTAYCDKKTGVQFDDFKIEKLVPAIDKAETYNTVIDINFDSNTVGGISASDLSTTTAGDGVLTLAQGKGAAGAVWFANSTSVCANQIKPPSTAKNDTTAVTKAEELLKLEPSTTYKITFKYRWRDDASTSAGLNFMAATNPHASTNHGRGTHIAGLITEIDGNDTTAADETFGGDNTKYHDWKEETYIFTTKADIGTRYLGMRVGGSSNGAVGLQLDDFKVETVNTDNSEIYVFDYKTGNEPLSADLYERLNYNNNIHYVLCNSNAEGGSYIDADGMHVRPSNTNGFTFGNFAWNHNALVFDMDVTHNGQHYIKVDANHLYIVTVKFKVVSVKGNAGIAIALKAGDYSSQEVVQKYYGAVVEGSQYLTGVVDAASVSALNNRMLMLTASAQSGTEFLVESVVVTAVDKSTEDVALVKTNSNDPYVYDIEFVKRGTELPAYSYINNNTIGANETAYNISYVNPSIVTTRIDTDGDDYIYAPNGTATGNTYLDAYEDEERGTVVKISTSKGSGLSTSTFNFNEFKPEAGKKYYITFDAKLLENNNKNEAKLSFERLYYSGASGISQSGNKTEIAAGNTNSKVTALTSTALTTEWKTYGWVLNAMTETGDVANRPYVSFAVPHSGTNKGADVSAGVFVVDNFNIVEYTTEGAATAPNNATDAMASIRGYGVSEDGSYQSAGLRFRATVSADAKAAASEIGFIVAPAKAAKAAGAEWYAIDGELVAGVSALKQACYVKDSKDIAYSDLGDKGTAYQMILKGLSTEDGKTAFNQRFVAVMYITAEDGTVEYYNLGETSYNEMLTSYGIAGKEVPEV